MKKKPKLNIFKDYTKFLSDNDELNNNDIVDTFAHEFIKFIENTSMSKTYKIPVLLSFYNNRNMKLQIDDDNLYDSFKKFYANGSNKVDMLKDKSTAKFETWEKKQYVSLARKNPVHYLCKSSSEFFTIEGDKVCLNRQLEKYLDNENFLNHFKDAIDFRTKEYYKNRIKEK